VRGLVVIDRGDVMRAGNWAAEFWSGREIAECHRELAGLEPEDLQKTLVETLATIPTVFGPAAQAWLRETRAATTSLASQLAELFGVVADEETPLRQEAAKKAVAAKRFDGPRLLLAAPVVCALKRRFLRRESLKEAEKAAQADIGAAFARLAELEAVARGMSSRHIKKR